MEASLEQSGVLAQEQKNGKEKEEMSWEQSLLTFRTLVQSSKMKEMLLKFGVDKWETEFNRFGKWFEEVIIQGDLLDEDIRSAFSTEEKPLENKRKVIQAIGEEFSQAGGWDRKALNDPRIKEILQVVDNAYAAYTEMLEKKAA